MKKVWKLKDLENKILPNLPEYPSLIVRLLALRGLTDPDKIKDFINPDYAKLHDPFLFADMQKAVERIRLAIEQKEKITIFADYDADAITAAAVVFRALKKLVAEPEAYIPDRFTEGYGMNLEAIKSIGDNGTKLIITVDCGINAVEEAKLCLELGIDLIITDHHEVAGELPQALAVINPKNPKDNYPFPFLTGVGVAYKLVQALIEDDWHKWLLDLVAIGTVADCQSLSDENRILVNFGLKVLAKTKWVGLRKLLELAKVSGAPDTFTLGFILAPRINAAGRIKHANAAFELLITDDADKAEALAKELDDLNKHRQSLTEQILSEAKGQVELATDKKIILVFGNDWPKGVVGLVAGKLSESYNRPALAVSTTVEGLAVGSARSVENFDMVAALTFSSEYLEKYGGHKQAAGFSLASVNLSQLHMKLLEYAETVNLTLDDPVLKIDAEVKPEDISWEVIEYLEKMAPFGIGNPRPKLVAYSLELLDLRLVGSGKHLKMKLGFGNHKLEAIAFGQAFLANNLQIGQKLDAVFELGVNEWNGNKEMQLKIIDIKLYE